MGPTVFLTSKEMKTHYRRTFYDNNFLANEKRNILNTSVEPLAYVYCNENLNLSMMETP